MANLSMYGKNPLKSVSEYSREMAGTDLIDSQTAQNRMKMQQEQQAIADDNALRSVAREFGPDPNANAQLIVSRTGRVSAAQVYLKGVADIEHTKGQAAQAVSTAAKNVIDTRAKKMDYFASLIGRAGTDAQTGLGIVASAYQDPELGPMLTRDFGPMMQIMPHLQEKASTPEGWAQVQGPLAMGLKDYSEQQLKQQIANQPQIFSLDTGDNQVVAGFNKSTGKPMFTNAFPKSVSPSVQLQSDTQMAVAGMKPGAGTTLEKPPAGYRWTADGNQEAVPGGPADLKKTNVLNQDMSTLTSSTSALDRLALTANQVLNHPGLPNITGIPGAFPNIPGGKAADAEAQLNVLKSQVAFGVLQDMRNNSKTGGALGNVSDAEGKRLEANLAALEKAQSFDQFQSSLKQIIKFTEDAKNNLRKAYNTKHGEAGPASSDTPVPVKNDADYHALPSGTRFITPDGKTGTKK
jgi:hypothetical protein